MGLKSILSGKRKTISADSKAAKAQHKGKSKAQVTLPDLKDMVLPLLEREGLYDPNP